MKFKVLAGIHHQAGLVYTTGDIVANAHDLTKNFEGKFEKMPDAVPASPGRRVASGDVIVPPPAKVPVVEADDEDIDTGADRGKDVTTQFPTAKDQDYSVFKTKDKKYFVYDNDAPTKPVNTAGVTKDEVDGVIKEALKA